MIPLAYLRRPQDGLRLRFATHQVSIGNFHSSVGFTYLFKCHSILNQKCDSRIEVSDIFFKHEVLLGLAGYLGLEVAKSALCPRQVIADLKILLLRTHADIQCGHTNSFALSH
jgi:hypothetical protein